MSAVTWAAQIAGTLPPLNDEEAGRIGSLAQVLDARQMGGGDR